MNANTIKTKCTRAGISEDTYMYRKSIPLKEKDIFSPAKIPWQDHKGEKFYSKKGLLSKYNISDYLFTSRIKRGWSLADTLTVSKASEQESFIDDLIKQRKYVILSEPTAIKTENVTSDENDPRNLLNKPEELFKLCSEHGISVEEYKRRVDAGWVLKDILNTPQESDIEDSVVAPDGAVFPSLEIMCTSYGVYLEKFLMKISTGYSVAEALENK